MGRQQCKMRCIAPEAACISSRSSHTRCCLPARSSGGLSASQATDSPRHIDNTAPASLPCNNLAFYRHPAHSPGPHPTEPPGLIPRERSSERPPPRAEQAHQRGWQVRHTSSAVHQASIATRPRPRPRPRPTTSRKNPQGKPADARQSRGRCVACDRLEWHELTCHHSIDSERARAERCGEISTGTCRSAVRAAHACDARGFDDVRVCSARRKRCCRVRGVHGAPPAKLTLLICGSRCALCTRTLGLLWCVRGARQQVQYGLHEIHKRRGEHRERG
ncbi:hypothetical protein BD413DRAFT_171515 [Trametes elegans]|nr:hypothetical protein BD413DRAFT_171515 [Trametes elegans]